MEPYIPINKLRGLTALSVSLCAGCLKAGLALLEPGEQAAIDEDFGEIGAEVAQIAAHIEADAKAAKKAARDAARQAKNVPDATQTATEATTEPTEGTVAGVGATQTTEEI